VTIPDVALLYAWYDCDFMLNSNTLFFYLVLVTDHASSVDLGVALGSTFGVLGLIVGSVIIFKVVKRKAREVGNPRFKLIGTVQQNNTHSSSTSTAGASGSKVLPSFKLLNAHCPYYTMDTGQASRKKMYTVHCRPKTTGLDPESEKKVETGTRPPDTSLGGVAGTPAGGAPVSAFSVVTAGGIEMKPEPYIPIASPPLAPAGGTVRPHGGFVEAVPNFARILSVMVDLKCYVDLSITAILNGDALVEKPSKAWVKVAPNPFAQGNVRLAYYAQQLYPPKDDPSSAEPDARWTTKAIILKEYIRLSAEEEHSYTQDLSVQHFAQMFAVSFNADMAALSAPGGGMFSVNFLQTKVAVLPGASVPSRRRLMSLEFELLCYSRELEKVCYHLFSSCG
jgi:hypothetical protein